MKKEIYAVINTNWKEDGFGDPFYEQMMAIRGGEQIFGLAVFLKESEAKKFKGKDRKDKIVKMRVDI